MGALDRSPCRAMKSRVCCSLVLVGLAFLVNSCADPGELVVLREVTGPGETNCYLLYDAGSKEAALIDVGGPVDSLVAQIKNNALELRYIFTTHMHMDHVEGVIQILERFPDARLCYNRSEYEDFLVFRDWMEENLPEMVAGMKQSPEYGKWFEYDLSLFREPDLYLEDNQVYMLGNLRIQTMLTPGHSRGSICFRVNDALFSGDVLFFRRVGRTDLLGGSREEIIDSVRRLYDELPDATKVYPGHGEFTDIGSEKKENANVTASAVNLEN